MWLDSASFGTKQGRYDIVVSDPLQTLVTHGMETSITDRDGSVCISENDPFVSLRMALAPLSCIKPDELPFVGGAVGYFSYDMARVIEELPARAYEDQNLPEMAIGIYEWAYIADHHERRSWLAGIRSDSLEQRWESLCEQFDITEAIDSRITPLVVKTAPASDVNESAYEEAFLRIQHYLREGDCYQVNYARHFTARVTGDAFAGYCRLREFNSAPFSAYLNLPFAQVMSSSPERFLRVTDRRVETRPIKGTRPRSMDVTTDHKLAEELRLSLKDRAENLMIVDLLRNDLGRSCQPGSVRVPELFTVESFATVHHLVSTVTGELSEDKDAIDLLRGAFPGGSITGAPKRRAMEIIEELETHRRGIYCGAIGYIGCDGNMDTNIAIRTLVHRDGEITFWAGGGIVVDSNLQSEFQETLDKAAGMMRLFEK